MNRGGLGVILLCVALSAAAENRYGIAADLGADLSGVDGTLQTGAAETDESFDFHGDRLSWRLWGSVPFKKGRLLFGMQLRLPLRARTSDTREGYEFGYAFEPSVAYEYSAKWKKNYDIPLGVHLGIPILIPSGDFANEIDTLEPVGAWGGPRVGWLLGASVGVRRQLSKRFFLRGDFRVERADIYLFATRATVSGQSYRKNWKTNALRVSLGLGLEVEL